MNQIFVINVLLVAISGALCDEEYQTSDDSTLPEVGMNTTEILRYYGYPAEVHYVTTEDGYILSLVRIPHGRSNTTKKNKSILMVHALLDSSDTWVINPPNQSLAFILADEGYEVWLGNNRGNTYSKQHKTLSIDSKEFWDFSFEEMAKYDLPAFINHITNVTKTSKINYVGHSEGTVIGFIEFARNQELASKVDNFVALGPVGTMKHAKGAFKVISHVSGLINFMMRLFGVKEFMPKIHFPEFLKNKVCITPRSQRICAKTMFLFFGDDMKSLNMTRLPVYLTHTPAGTSVKNIMHVTQVLKSDVPSQYDYGYWGNYWKYGSIYPPQYDVTTMKTKVALFYGSNDVIATPQDIESYLIPRLSHLVYNKKIENYNHMDFTWGSDARQTIYEKIIQLFD